jgi:hypothetical protein
MALYLVKHRDNLYVLLYHIYVDIHFMQTDAVLVVFLCRV